MPTDVDDRLREAGRRYRDTHRTATVIDFEPRARLRRGSILIAAAVVVVMAAAGAATVHHIARPSVSVGSDVGRAGLVGPTWTLTQISSSGRVVPVRGVAMTITFTATRLRASDACNTQGGPVRVSVRTVTVGNIGSTDVGCGRDGAAYREAFFDVILKKGTLSWSTEMDRLTLRRGSSSAVFTSQANPSLLSGTQWSLTSWRTGGTIHDLASTGTTSVAFVGTDRVEVRAGCGAAGQMSVSSSTLTVSSLHVNACAGPNDDPPYTSLLAGPVQWRLDGTELTLRRGTLQFEFSPAQL